MKLFGFLIGLLLSLAILVVTFLVGVMLADKVPKDYQKVGAVVGVGFLGAGAFGAKKTWKGVMNSFDRMARRRERRRVAREAEEIRRIRAKSQVQADRHFLLNTLHRTLENSRAVVGGLSILIKGAEHCLDTAEKEWFEMMYSSFWAAVFEAVSNLATFQSHLELLAQNARMYASESERASEVVPRFDLGSSGLPDPKLTLDRMESLVRRAFESGPEFEATYQIRKLERVDVGGFASLDDAMRTLPARLIKARLELDEALRAFE